MSSSKYHPYRYETSDEEEVPQSREKKSEKKKKISFEDELSTKDESDDYVKSNKREKKHVLSEPSSIENDAETDGAMTDGGDNSCVDMSTHFIRVIQNTIKNEDVSVLRDTLHKTPIAVVLHYCHYLFYSVRENPDFTDVMLEYNKKYNIVSKYFLKSLRDDNRAKRAMSMLVEVTNDIMNGVEKEDIKNLIHFTPEFQIMVSIQYGEIKNAEKIRSEWEISRRFEGIMDLIAAFFGIKRYFSNPDNYSESRELIISAICGGSTKTLSRIVRKTSEQYLTEYTLRKTRAFCIPNSQMVKFLRQKYDLEFS